VNTAPVRKSLHDILWVAGPKVLGAAAQLSFNLILLRFLMPADYGTISVCLSGILLIDAVMGSALDMGILRLAPSHAAQGRMDDALGVQQAAFMLKPIGGLLLGITVIAYGPELSTLLFQRSDRAGLILLSVVALIGLQLMRSIQAHFQVNQKFVAYGAADLLHNVLRFGGIALLLASGHPPLWGILAFYAAAPIVVSAALLASGARALVSVMPRWASFREFGALILWYLPAAAVGSMLGRIDLFMVTRYAGVSEAGIFSAAQVLVVAPQLLGSYVAVVFGPLIMPRHENGTLGAFYRKTQIALALACAGLFLMAWAAVSFLAPIVLPDDYQRAAGILLLLLPSTLAPLLNYPLCVQVLLFLRPKAVLAFDLVCAAPLLLAYRYAIVNHGTEGAAVVTTSFAVMKTVFLQVFAWRVVSKSRLLEISPKYFPAFLGTAGRVEHPHRLEK
jgi:O-antigen/teichoic acid export membrane protein